MVLGSFFKMHVNVHGGKVWFKLSSLNFHKNKQVRNPSILRLSM